MVYYFPVSQMVHGLNEPVGIAVILVVIAFRRKRVRRLGGGKSPRSPPLTDQLLKVTVISDLPVSSCFSFHIIEGMMGKTTFSMAAEGRLAAWLGWVPALSWRNR